MFLLLMLSATMGAPAPLVISPTQGEEKGKERVMVTHTHTHTHRCKPGSGPSLINAEKSFSKTKVLSYSGLT